MKQQTTMEDTTLRHDAVDIIDVIRKLRNDLIKDFLDERNLVIYLSEQFRIMELNKTSVEFIKKDLKQMLIAPVNTVWYKPVIDDFYNTGSAALAEGNEKLFYKEIEEVLKRHLFS
ncbi:hypothetical protein [Dawidia soli]|uniref:Uncharacterized protein n=1 Tax=Dawidia soli TaxID=2782352 RepID=A0AAP2GC26_9BACT|nr:hypothetical protein [Dawidia soli]MBT1685819.1 hypothetical protein [Dawidia soli]